MNNENDAMIGIFYKNNEQNDILSYAFIMNNENFTS